MSSIYRLLCLNHDPALVITDDERHEQYVPERDSDALRDHRACDIMIGAYSYPIVQVGCFGTSIQGPTGCKGNHSHINWIDVDWLRLLIAASMVLPPKLTFPFTGRCWTPERMKRLGPEIGVNDER